MILKNAKPLLLIDVDGVLNPFDMDPAIVAAKGFDSYRITTARTGRTLTVWLNRAHGAWLRGLTDDFELVWVTTWADEANSLIGPKIGLPSLPVVAPVWIGLYRQSKCGPVREFVKGRPFAWLDDNFEREAYDWVRRRDPAGKFTLLLRPDSAVGLTGEQVQALRRFAADLRARQTS